MKTRYAFHFSLSLLLAGCASQKQAPLTVSVTPTGYVVDGEILKGRAELADAIIRHKAKIVDIRPGKQASYDDVRDAVLAVRDAGAKLPVVGNEIK